MKHNERLAETEGQKGEVAEIPKLAVVPVSVRLAAYLMKVGLPMREVSHLHQQTGWTLRGTKKSGGNC